MISQQYLKSRLRYDSETGVFVWVSVNKYHPRLTGKPAGSIREGYVVIKIDGKGHRAHRLAWLYMRGFMPAEVDHENRNKSDNRWTNLRECTHAQNVKNHSQATNGSGLPVGVRPMPSGRYQARITCDGDIHHLGAFDTIVEASKAYWAKRYELFGGFA